MEREGDSHNPNNTLWNWVLVRLTGFAGEQSFHTCRFCNCRGKPWYKLQKVKRQERLFPDPFWSGADPRAWIMEPAEHRMLKGRSRLSLCTALDVRATTNRGGRWWSPDLGAQPAWVIPQKASLKVSQLRSSQPRDSCYSEIQYTRNKSLLWSYIWHYICKYFTFSNV